jgi:hypothetical protein
MYKIVFTRKETCNNQSVKEVNEYPHQFRLKRNAVHFVREIFQNDFKKEGYATELIPKGGLSCIKTEITSKGNRNEIEFIIEVKKI